jgi:hypothetical protein
MTHPTPRLSAIEAIREKLRRYPQLRADETATSITVPPESRDGFPVRLDQHSRGYTVYFAGWRASLMNGN